jgi:hypothetical protein
MTINDGMTEEMSFGNPKTYVVIAVEQDDQNTHSGWKQEKTIFGERIRLEKPSAIEHTNLVEGLFIVAVQRCEINI